MNTKSAVKFTELEQDVIDGFAGGDYNEARYSFFDDGIVAGSDTWADTFISECGDPKVYRGVIASLIKKGFFESFKVEHEGHYLLLTPLAIEVITGQSN